jgi:hypothetical protein
MTTGLSLDLGSEIGNLHEPAPVWQEAVTSRVMMNEPTLVRSDGSIYGISRDHQNLLDFKLRPDDLYIVGPHGEMLMFVALAIQQQVLKTRGNMLCHIDAHPDNMEEDVMAAGGIHYQKIAGAMRGFIGREPGETPPNPLLFKGLQLRSNNTIRTFMQVLRDYFPELVAFIRRENGDLKGMNRMDPVGMGNFLHLLESIPQSARRPRDIIEETRINVYSIDADFCGCTKEHSGKQTREQFQTRMEFLIDMMMPELDKPLDYDNPTLYTVSLDPRWCAYPEEFIVQFLRDFYTKLIEARAL